LKVFFNDWELGSGMMRFCETAEDETGGCPYERFKAEILKGMLAEFSGEEGTLGCRREFDPRMVERHRF
jgi:hypothetical protein